MIGEGRKWEYYEVKGWDKNWWENGTNELVWLVKKIKVVGGDGGRVG